VDKLSINKYFQSRYFYRFQYFKSAFKNCDAVGAAMKMLEADLSAGKGVLWLKSPQPAPDGALFVARYMGQGKADFQPGADLFVHVVFGPSGDRCGGGQRAGWGSPCGICSSRRGGRSRPHGLARMLVTHELTPHAWQVRGRGCARRRVRLSPACQPLLAGPRGRAGGDGHILLPGPRKRPHHRPGRQLNPSHQLRLWQLFLSSPRWSGFI